MLILDLSKWNWPPDFARMRTAGVNGLIIRASYGTIRDERLDEFMTRHRSAGSAAPPVVAFYHYYHPWQPWRPQLDTLLAAMRDHGVRRGDLDLEDMRFVAATAVGGGEAALETLAFDADGDIPPAALRRLNEQALRLMVIDPEATDDGTLYLDGGVLGALEATPTVQTKLIEDARLFMTGLREAIPLPAGKRHMVYSNWSYIRAILGNAAWLGEYDLHLAAWTTAARPVVPAPWAKWVVWQYSSSGDGRAHGVGSARVDMNRFNGSAAEFEAWRPYPAPEVSVEAALWADAMRRNAPLVNWDFGLPRAIRAGGDCPVFGEYTLTHGGREHTYQIAQGGADGKMRVYYAPTGDWGAVKAIAGPETVAPLPPPPPAPTPPTVDVTRAFRPVETTGEARGPFLVYAHDDGRTEDAQYLVRGQDVFLIKGGNYERFRVTTDGVYRYEDTSHGEATYYTLRDVGATPYSGHRWLPAVMEIGRPYRRAAQVSIFRKADCVLQAAGGHITWALLDRVIPSASLSGHVVRNVLDLYVANSEAVKEQWFERYWYALGTATQDGRAEVRGLVQWWAREDRMPRALIAHSVLVDAPPGRPPLPLSRPACLA